MHARKPLKHCVKGNRRFQPREVRTEAKMDSFAKREVFVGTAPDVELAGVLEPGGVAVGGGGSA